MSDDKNVLQLNIPGVIRILGTVFIILLLLSLAANTFYFSTHKHAYINSLFSLDEESNIPTLYASVLLFIASFLFYFIYRLKRKGGDAFTYYWLGMAVIFLLMGIDESCRLHEQTSQFLRPYVKRLDFAWVIPGFIFVLVFVLAYLKFFLNLEYRWKKLFFFSGLIYLTGAIGLEFVGNMYEVLKGQNNLTYALITNLEETFEFSGTILLIYAQLRYLAKLDPYYVIEMNERKRDKVNLPAASRSHTSTNKN